MLQPQSRLVSQFFKLFVFVFICAPRSSWPAAQAAATRSLDGAARTVYYKNRVPNAAGDYRYDFQTSNGITTKAAGNAYGASGVVQYVSPEGVPITMTYVADADGFHPKGEHIPAMPAYVLTALEYIRTHAAVDERSSRKLSTDVLIGRSAKEIKIKAILPGTALVSSTNIPPAISEVF